MGRGTNIAKLVKFAKPILLTCNAISSIYGIALFVLGIWIQVDFTAMMAQFWGNEKSNTETKVVRVEEKYEEKKDEGKKEKFEEYLAILSGVAIGLGALILLLNTLGCIGAFKQLKRFLIPYIIFIILLILVEIAGLVLSVIEWDNLIESFKGLFEYRIASYGINTEITESWNNYMDTYNCCGVNNGSDFTYIAKGINETHPLPPYCCSDAKINCTVSQALNDTMPGCTKHHIDEGIAKYRFDIAILSLDIGLKLLETIATIVIMHYTVDKDFWAWRGISTYKDKKMDSPEYHL